MACPRPVRYSTRVSEPTQVDAAEASPRAPNPRVAGASLWAVGGLLGRQGLRLGGNVVFTRLLFPEAFGLMAIVNSLRTGLEMVSDLGIAPAIVQNERGTDPRFLDTAWTFQVARGAVLFAITLALAYPVAALYGAPELVGLVPVAGLALLISSFNSTELALLQRRLDVRRYEGILLASQAVAVLTILVWCWIQPSVWALVAGGVASSVVRLVLSHVVADHRNRFHWDPEAGREIFHFGKWIFLSTVLTFFADEADRLILGAVADLGELGVYSIALLFATLPGMLVHQLGQLVLFPALSRSGREARALRLLFRRLRAPLVAVGGAAVVALASGATPLIDLLYDPRYADAAWMLQGLAVGVWFRTLEIPGRAALLAVGETRWMAVLNGTKFAFVLVGLPLGYGLAGFPGAIAALALSDAARYAVCCLGTARAGLGVPWGDVVPTLLGLVAVWAGTGAATTIEAGAFVRLLAGVAAGLLVFLPLAALSVHRSGFLAEWRAGRT